MVCMEEMNIVIYGKSHDVKKNCDISGSISTKSQHMDYSKEKNEGTSLSLL